MTRCYYACTHCTGQDTTFSWSEVVTKKNSLLLSSSGEPVCFVSLDNHMHARNGACGG
jgi:hypothetical protein